MVEKNKKISFKKMVFPVIAFTFFGFYPSAAGAAQPVSQSPKVQEKAIKELQKLTQYEIDGSFLISQCY
jgi:hypothetical protein